jgi:guanosine-3',5'-bis(diphosphate) 3'-pyrophosphohydrolase
MSESRVLHLEKTLTWMGFEDSIRALDWMKQEMCTEKGFSRHNGSHYYHHLVAVAQDLLDFGVKDQEIITASLLHDAIEDVEGITYLMIKDKFGQRVADMVQRVTKLKGVDYKNPENFIAYLKIVLQDMGSSLIKASDRKHNIGTLLDATPEKKMRQAHETETCIIPFLKEARNLYPRYAGYFFSVKTTVEPHIWEIKEHYAEVEKLNKIIRELQQGA